MSNNPRPRAHADNNPHWDQARSTEAIAQGWDVFDCGDGLAIQRIDSPEDGSQPRFETDDDAIQLVKVRARNGDPLAKAALAEVATCPRGSHTLNKWKRLVPTVAGWYFVDSMNGGIFPVELVERDTTTRRDGSLLVTYIGHGARDMEQFLRMFGRVQWFGPIELPPTQE